MINAMTSVLSPQRRKYDGSEEYGGGITLSKLKPSYSGDAEALPNQSGYKQYAPSSGGAGKMREQSYAALEGTHKYLGNTPYYQGTDAVAGIKGYMDGYNAVPRDEFGGLTVNAVGPHRIGDFLYEPTGDGRYYVVNTKDKTFGTEKTMGDVFDKSGKFLGTQTFNTKENGLSKFMTGLTKALAVAGVGVGLAGLGGVGPAAGGGATPAGAAGAGAGGAGAGAGGIGAAAGDAGLMYAGADAAAAATLGSAPATLGGSVAAGGAAAGGGGFMDLIKSGANSVFGGGGSGGGGGMFDWGDVFNYGVKAYDAYAKGNAAEDAANAQIQANQQSMQMLEPWRQGGAWAMGRAGDMLGRSGSRAAKAAFYKDPGYQFRVDEGQKLIDRDKARGGKFFSGERGKALVNYGQNMGSQEFTNAFNRYMAMSGMGQTAANTSGGYASAMGDSRAAAEVARANAWGNALTGMYDTWQQNQMMDRYLG